MKKCPSCSSVISDAALICPACRTSFTELSDKLNQENKITSTTKNIDKFEGEANISLPAYQLYLTRKFNIEKNSTLEKYIIGDQVYNHLDEALSASDVMYKMELEKEKSRLLKLESIRLAEEKFKLELAEKDRIDKELHIQKKREEDERLAPIHAAKKKKIVIGFITCFIVFSSFAVYYSNQQKKEREAKELAEKIEREKILEQMRLAEKERLEQQQKIKEELAKFFSTGVFLGFKIGENNLENLSKLASQPIRKDFGDYSIKCEEGQCSDLLKDSPLKNVFKKIQFSYCVPDAQESKGKKFFKMKGFEIDFKEYRDVAKYKEYLDANIKVPEPPRSVIRKYEFVAGKISLEWTKDLQSSNYNYKIEDICDNRRGLFGSRPHKW
jgi:hypothetical protein